MRLQCCWQNKAHGAGLLGGGRQSKCNPRDLTVVRERKLDFGYVGTLYAFIVLVASVFFGYQMPVLCDGRRENAGLGYTPWRLRDNHRAAFPIR